MLAHVFRCNDQTLREQRDVEAELGRDCVGALFALCEEAGEQGRASGLA